MTRISDIEYIDGWLSGFFCMEKGYKKYPKKIKK